MRTATILMVMLALVALATVGGFTTEVQAQQSGPYYRGNWEADGRRCNSGRYNYGYDHGRDGHGIDLGRIIETAIVVGADIYQSRNPKVVVVQPAQQAMYGYGYGQQSMPMPASEAYGRPVPAHLAIYGVRNGYGQSGYGQPVADSYPPVPASARTTIVNNNNIVVMQTPQAHQPPAYVAPALVLAAPAAPAFVPPPPPVVQAPIPAAPVAPALVPPPPPVAPAPVTLPSEAAKEPTPPAAPAPKPIASAPVAPVAEGGWLNPAVIVLAVLVAILVISLVIVIRRRGGRGGEPAPAA